MSRYFYQLLSIGLFFSFLQGAFGDNIGLLIMATGKYISFVDPLIVSAEKHFCKNHNVTYFIFTDSDRSSTSKITYIYQKKLGWPFDTMLRYQIYLESQDLLQSQDYLFACDADMLFVGEVGDEILGDLVATLHPGFINGRRGDYETNPLSLAYIAKSEGENYFAGGFYGGKTKEVLKLAKINSDNINQDLTHNFIAVWHDESHWNRYCIDHTPTVILSPSYCCPEGWGLPYIPKLMPLNKNHAEIRGN